MTADHDSASLATRTGVGSLFRIGRSGGLLTFRSTRRVGGSGRLVLIGHVAGLSGVAILDSLVSITLHLLAGLRRLACLVSITLNLIFGLLAGCGLLLLRRRREGKRASGNDND